MGNNTKKKIIEAKPYPYNIIDFLMEQNGLEQDYPDDVEEGFYFVLNNLRADYREVIEYRYRDKMILNEIAEIIQRSRDIVRQREYKAIRLLSHPSRFQYIQYGLEEGKRRVQNYVITLESPTDVLGLSFRTWNGLKRKGYDTIGKVVDAYNERLLIEKIPNFGEKSYEEISKKLLEYGFISKELRRPEKEMKRSIVDMNISESTKFSLLISKINYVRGIIYYIRDNNYDCLSLKNLHEMDDTKYDEIINELISYGFDIRDDHLYMKEEE